MTDRTTRRELSLGAAILPVLVMFGLFITGAISLGIAPELLVAVLLCSAAVAGVIAVRHGHTWEEIQRALCDKFAAVLPVILILLAIGMLISTWILSGTIPFLVYWGVKLVRPEYLALTAFVATAIMSSFTGTSWGSAGTIGVAFMGTAVALDAPLGIIAGAIVSGAYLGDKMSPLSDSTIISALSAGTPLYTHIRHMLYTATPSFVIALVVYFLAARLAPSSTAGLPDSALALLADIELVFALHWTALIPPALVVWSIVRRRPATLAIALSSLAAALIGIVIQDFAVLDAIKAAVSGFRLEMVAATEVETGSLTPAFATLVQRGGLYSMATTLVVIIAAFLLAAGMEVSGALDLLIGRMLRAVRSTFGLIAATMGAGLTMIGLTSHGGVTALLIGGIFQDGYRERGLAPENLSRSIEDSVTITEPLMPWTVSASFMAGTLGVPTLEYAPWAVFCYGGPVFSLLIAALYRRTGYGIKRLSTVETITPDRPPAPPVAAG